MSQTIDMFLDMGISHELKAMEAGSVAITPKTDYVVIDYGDGTEVVWQ